LRYQDAQDGRHGGTAKAKEQGIASTFIMISAHGSTEMAVDATKIGAFDFLQKPPDLNRLLITLRNALTRAIW